MSDVYQFYLSSQASCDDGVWSNCLYSVKLERTLDNHLKYVDNSCITQRIKIFAVYKLQHIS